MPRAAIQRLDMELTMENIAEVVDQAVKLLRPQWRKENVVHKRNLEGFVNLTVIVSSDGEDMSDALVLRTLNETFGGSIADQQHGIGFLNKNDLCPAVLAFIKNGICMEFVKGKMLKWTDWRRLKEPNVWKPIAHTLARWHRKSLYEKAVAERIVEQQYLLWGPVVVLKWDKIIALPEMEKYRSWLPDAARLLAEEKDVIQRTLAAGDLDKALCHLDLNVSNVSLDEEKGESTLIDYDYLSISYLQVDLAWFFYIFQDIENWNMAEYPNEAYRREFLAEYLNCRKRLDGEPEATKAEVDRLVIQVEKIKLICHLRSVVDGPCMWDTSKNDSDRKAFFGFMPSAEMAWSVYQAEKEDVLSWKSSQE